MTRLTVGLRALLAALFCAAPFCAPPHAATVPLLHQERGGLPSFDTSYYLILAPQTSPHLLLLNTRNRRTSSRMFRRNRPALPVVRVPATRIVFANLAPPTITTHPHSAVLRRFVALRAVPRSMRSSFDIGAPPFSFGTSNLFARTGSPHASKTNVVLAQQTPSPVPLPAGIWFLGSAICFGVFFFRRKA